MNYLFFILTLVCIYIILTSSLNLIAGYTGLVSMAHAAFYGIGAYTTALLSVYAGTNLVFNLILGIVGAGVLGAIIAIPTLRLHDDYFIVATFGFQLIIYSVFNNWVSLTGGPVGIPGIPEASIFGLVFDEPWKLLILAVILAALSYLIVNQLVRSPFGRVLEAIREDEVFARSMGKNVTTFKIKVFVIGGAIASIGGLLYAHLITYIDPSSFTVMESILILSMVIVGGSGRLLGSVLGAVILVLLPEILRVVGIPNVIAANIRQILYGALLVLFVILLPQGILGEYSLRRTK